jgi:hypothetical protein
LDIPSGDARRRWGASLRCAPWDAALFPHARHGLAKHNQVPPVCRSAAGGRSPRGPTAGRGLPALPQGAPSLDAPSGDACQVGRDIPCAPWDAAPFPHARQILEQRNRAPPVAGVPPVDEARAVPQRARDPSSVAATAEGGLPAPPRGDPRWDARTRAVAHSPFRFRPGGSASL